MTLGGSRDRLAKKKSVRFQERMEWVFLARLSLFFFFSSFFFRQSPDAAHKDRKEGVGRKKRDPQKYQILASRPLCSGAIFLP
jgi:hypothetical protein